MDHIVCVGVLTFKKHGSQKEICRGSELSEPVEG